MHRRRFRITAIVLAFLAAAASLPRTRSAVVGSWGGSLWLTFLLPLTAVAVCVLFQHLARRDPLRGNYQRFRDTYELVLNAGVAFVVGLHLILLVTLLGGPSWIGRAPSLLVGTLLVLVGNVLPRVRPNLMVGVRTPWTLGDEQAWARTHRWAGYALVAFGLVVLALGALAPQRAGRVVSLGTLSLAVALIAASYWIRRRSTTAAREPRE